MEGKKASSSGEISINEGLPANAGKVRHADSQVRNSTAGVVNLFKDPSCQRVQ